MPLIDTFPVKFTTPFYLAWDVYPGWHSGADIFAATGCPVVAAKQGQVIRTGWNNMGGFRVGVLADGKYYYYYAHLLENIPVRVGEWVETGRYLGYVDQSGDAAPTSPHLHFGIRDEETGEWLYFWEELVQAYERDQKRRRRKSMIEQGVPTKDGWWKAGWFTGDYPQTDHCMLVITSGLNPPSRIEVYLEEPGGGKRGIKELSKFKKHETKLLSNSDIPVNGMIWLKPEGGELLDVTVRTVLK